MTNKKVDNTRRNFLKTITAATACSLLAGTGEGGSVQTAHAATPSGKVSQKSKYPQVPRRILGKTGISVSVLNHGLMYNILDNQATLKRGLMWGVDFWDTAHMYAGGNSELGVGKFITRNPDVRKSLYIVSKASYATTIDEREERLKTSLKRMNTDYIDLYYGIHALSDPDDLNNELKSWAMDAKKRGLIRHFGFSTHRNMSDCLKKAAELDWIDAIMTSYNFRLMQDRKLNKAIDRCRKANIGLIAMKTQGKTIRSKQDRKLTDHFLATGYTDGQAKLKAVLEDKRFASVCITMQSGALLVSNVAAALDKVKLSSSDKTKLQEHAVATSSDFCSGCGTICDRTVDGAPISDVMRYLMYYHSYGEKEKARKLFAEIDHRDRKKLAEADFSAIEQRCPQKLPIGHLVQEAVELLG